MVTLAANGLGRPDARAGTEVQLLNAPRVRQLRGRKTHIEDSRWLARMCRFGLGTPSFVPPRERTPVDTCR